MKRVHVFGLITGLLLGGTYALIALTWHAWTWFKRRKRRLP